MKLINQLINLLLSSSSSTDVIYGDTLDSIFFGAWVGGDESFYQNIHNQMLRMLLPSKLFKEDHLDNHPSLCHLAI